MPSSDTGHDSPDVHQFQTSNQTFEGSRSLSPRSVDARLAMIAVDLNAIAADVDGLKDRRQRATGERLNLVADLFLNRHEQAVNIRNSRTAAYNVT